ncbi:TetR family transcriptional regulator [Desulfobulbus rhabdoformis]|uniref:TetR family transcriptional regulator n=1 Tax=Desulfobulbus rhabdoformis TaxID=34032 RepID=UPI00196502AA|nr:TetR family transcriptional regulator [Desulfobulbus rhabdoformis]MBM9614964.1 TetR family transcriptional regulator [Desulfobulbus rhabdoformis]
MARRTKEEAMETRKAIMEAAVRVIASKGVAHASLTEIAKEAGVTRGAIYWHFANKADLLNSLWEQVLEFYTPLTKASENVDEPDPLGKMEELYLSFFAGMVDDTLQQQLFRILFDEGDRSKDTEAIRHRHQQCRHERYQGLQIVFNNAIKRGQIPQDFDVKLGTVTIFSMIHGLIANWVMNPEMVDIKKQGPIIVKMVFAMFRHQQPLNQAIQV